MSTYNHPPPYYHLPHADAYPNQHDVVDHPHQHPPAELHLPPATIQVPLAPPQWPVENSLGNVTNYAALPLDLPAAVALENGLPVQEQEEEQKQHPNNNYAGAQTEDDDSDDEDAEDQTPTTATRKPRRRREYRPPIPYSHFPARKKISEAEEKCEEARKKVVEAEENLKIAQEALQSAKDIYEKRQAEVQQTNEEMVDEILNAEHRRKWTKSYQKLKEFYDKHGHVICKCGNRPDKQNHPAGKAIIEAGESKAHLKDLNDWINHQRHDRRKGLLKTWRIIALDRLKFVWDEKDYEWHEMYKELQQHKAEHGTCRVKAPVKGSRRLYRWVVKQHQNYKKYMESGCQEPPHENTDEMTKKRLELLNELGVDWVEGVGWVGSVKRFDAYARKRTPEEQEAYVCAKNARQRREQAAMEAASVGTIDQPTQPAQQTAATSYAESAQQDQPKTAEGQIDSSEGSQPNTASISCAATPQTQQLEQDGYASSPQTAEQNAASGSGDSPQLAAKKRAASNGNYDNWNEEYAAPTTDVTTQRQSIQKNASSKRLQRLPGKKSTDASAGKTNAQTETSPAKTRAKGRSSNPSVEENTTYQGRGRPTNSFLSERVKQLEEALRKTQQEMASSTGQPAKRGRPRKDHNPSTAITATIPPEGKKRGRGRPRKGEDSTSVSTPTSTKRGRSRARKDDTTTTVNAGAASSTPPKRGRGRLPKDREESSPPPKRARGRPRGTVVEEHFTSPRSRTRNTRRRTQRISVDTATARQRNEESTDDSDEEDAVFP